MLSFDNKAFRRFASYAPYDVVEIVVNGRTYGGGGIYGLYSTMASTTRLRRTCSSTNLVITSRRSPTSTTPHRSPTCRRPRATNRGNRTSPRCSIPPTLKWKDLVKPGTPLPTRWEKETYEQQSRESQARRAELRKQGRPESEMEALFAEEHARDEAMFAKFRGLVGAYEGANYEAKGFYRPEANCIMFTRTDFFCAVCKRALERVIDTYSRP